MPLNNARRFSDKVNRADLVSSSVARASDAVTSCSVPALASIRYSARPRRIVSMRSESSCMRFALPAIPSILSISSATFDRPWLP